MHSHLKVDGRFWLTLDGKNFLGRGRIELLQRIRETGSISKAAKAMKMSYKSAWDAVDAMNSAWSTPLVQSDPAGSRLTAAAEQLILAFQQAEARHVGFMQGLTDDLLAGPHAATPSTRRR
ncbi:MAG TPA: LysR family transcriptional regulator [Thiobacillus sp.]|nr:MAG: transcriptional regulator [Hydrogenophilales bacterium 28-61-11]OYZ58305.1 MAG: transcriptional regulator [Hydrogenophilales bacterium 16-61-112]OZA44884.1 MAG: transcriptional regulator [Hydrogenophilales bacterium 17-61-76]HQT35125.1 LysR family transcriptional regulator [Thiobacillus sp.]HQT70340.1 LysR family transcriptional regulator [Thiobacillus sp.]